MGRLTDLTGKRFGRLVVLERAPNYISPRGQKVVCWKCKCDCGTEVIIQANSLKSGNTTSCGCYKEEQSHLPRKRGFFEK